MLTQNQENKAHLLSLAGKLNADYSTARLLVQLEALGEALRKRFEAECSYQWADTDAYRKRTNNMIEKAKALVRELPRRVKLEINRDPRGAAIRLRVARGARFNEYFL